MSQASETTQVKSSRLEAGIQGAVALPNGMDRRVARVARSLNMVTALCSFLSGSRRRGLAAPSISTP